MLRSGLSGEVFEWSGYCLIRSRRKGIFSYADVTFIFHRQILFGERCLIVVRSKGCFVLRSSSNMACPWTACSTTTIWRELIRTIPTMHLCAIHATDSPTSTRCFIELDVPLYYWFRSNQCRHSAVRSDNDFKWILICAGACRVISL